MKMPSSVLLTPQINMENALYTAQVSSLQVLRFIDNWIIKKEIRYYNVLLSTHIRVQGEIQSEFLALH